MPEQEERPWVSAIVGVGVSALLALLLRRGAAPAPDAPRIENLAIEFETQ